ncbi:hypothetical protein, partial [Tsukamurella paurometabola]
MPPSVTLGGTPHRGVRVAQAASAVTVVSPAALSVPASPAVSVPSAAGLSDAEAAGSDVAPDPDVLVDSGRSCGVADPVDGAAEVSVASATGSGVDTDADDEDEDGDEDED